MKAAHLAVIGAVVAIVAAAGCSTTEPGISGTQSLQIDLVSPASGGGSDLPPLADADRTVVVNIKAIDAQGNVDTTFNNHVDAFALFLGTLTPALGTSPALATFQLTNGVAMNQTIQLPDVFGPTVVMFDDDSNTKPTYATGATPALFFRQPFLQDIQRPVSETASNALDTSPLENKTISVGPTVTEDVGNVMSSRHGATGRLVVTSIFAQGYTVADVNCTDSLGTPPCIADDYDYLEVFSYSAAQDQVGNYLAEGETVDGIAGGVSEFDGLTELGFPQTFVFETPDINTKREPPAVVLDPSSWFLPQSDPSGGIINFERNEGGLIEIDNAQVCPGVATDPDYITYKQWSIDPNGGSNCASGKNLISLITAGVLTVDPTTLSGKTLTSVKGMLRPVNIGSFNVWIVYPRSDADLVVAQ